MNLVSTPIANSRSPIMARFPYRDPAKIRPGPASGSAELLEIRDIATRLCDVGRHYDWLTTAAKRTHRTADAASVVIDAVERPK